MSWSSGLRTSVTMLLVAGSVAGGAVISGVVPTGGGGGGGTCTTTLNSGASVSSAVSSAAGGAKICLNAGSYTFTAGQYTKASNVTVTPSAGVAASSVTVARAQFFPGSKNVTFDSLTMVGAQTGDTSAPATDLTFKNITWTGCVLIYQTSTAIMNLTFDGGTANLLPGVSGPDTPCIDDGRFIVRGNNAGVGTGDKNVVFKNMEFAGQDHCTDGIQVEGEARVTITNNVFHGITQGGGVTCSTHVDSIQFYGSDGTTVSNNYFYDFGDAIMSPDGDGDGTVFTNNVMGPGDAYPYAIVSCGSDNWTVTGNVVYGGKVWQQCAADSQSPVDTTSGMVFRNNVFGANIYTPAGNQANTMVGVTADHNICPTATTCNTTGGISGNATYVGGASPTTFAGFVLSGPSAALTGATDGGILGVRP